MSLNFTHKPNYFFNAQLLIGYIESYVAKHPELVDSLTFEMKELQDILRHDLASATTNLESILHIADKYYIDTINGDKKLIRDYKINVAEDEDNTLTIYFDQDALASLREGKALVAPAASSIDY